MTARLYAVMVACFLLGAMSAETMHVLPRQYIQIAAVSAVACFWIMYGLKAWYFGNTDH